ncbi:MAG: hypothetical protein KDD44_01040 [Bdellovibrionales bacterium]|nr:hypothetical protein [Bdellovibrionales bacterium]
MGPAAAAIGAANVSALVKLILKRSVSAGADIQATLQFYNLSAALILALVFGLPDFGTLNAEAAGLLALSGCLWVSGSSYDTKAYEHLEASASEVLGSLSLIFVTLAGIFLYGETIAEEGYVGICIILACIVLGGDISGIRLNLGLVHKLVGIVFQSAALIVDRHLATLIPANEVAFYAFAMCGLLHLTIARTSASQIPDTIQKCGPELLMLPILGAARYYLLIYALANGSLALSYALLQTTMIFIFIIEAAFLGLQQDLLKRGVHCACCATGAAVLLLSG